MSQNVFPWHYSPAAIDGKMSSQVVRAWYQACVGTGGMRSLKSGFTKGNSSGRWSSATQEWGRTSKMCWVPYAKRAAHWNCERVHPRQMLEDFIFKKGGIIFRKGRILILELNVKDWRDCYHLSIFFMLCYVVSVHLSTIPKYVP